MNWKKTLYAAIPSAIACFGIFTISLFGIKELEVENKETARSMILVSSSNCDLCVDQKEEWNKFKENSSINNLTFKELEVNSAEVFDFLDAHSVGGYPSVIILDERGLPIYENDGLHTYSDLEAAISGAVGASSPNSENQEGNTTNKEEVDKELENTESSEGDVVE